MIKLINLLKEADIRTLRRVVILALFTSDIPNQMEAAFKKRVSSNPDTDVIKANKKFLEQLLEDKALLMNDKNYQEFKPVYKYKYDMNSFIYDTNEKLVHSAIEYNLYNKLLKEL